MIKLPTFMLESGEFCALRELISDIQTDLTVIRYNLFDYSGVLFYNGNITLQGEFYGQAGIESERTCG